MKIKTGRKHIQKGDLVCLTGKATLKPCDTPFDLPIGVALEFIPAKTIAIKLDEQGSFVREKRNPYF